MNDEAELIVTRVNQKSASDAIVMQAAFGSTQTKEMGEVFTQLVNGLNGV